MFWDVSAGDESRSIISDGPFVGQHQIIDGQQRLTSLYAAIKGYSIRDLNYSKKQIMIAFNPFSKKFEVRTPPIAKSSEWVADISTVFDSSYKATRTFLRRYEEAGGELTDS